MLAYAAVSQRFGPRLALDGITLGFERGECVALVGPSGSGKTTLFRLAYGAFDPSAGHVCINGVNLATLRGRALRAVRSKIAVVFQAHGLIDQLSVTQNVIAGTFGKRSTVDALRAVIRPTAQECAAVLEALDHVGLRSRAGDRVFELSGGQRQRVAIARAVIQQAELVLADEPVASLDPQLGREIVELLLSDARERNATLVCSLHQPELARHFDRVVRLEGGRIAHDSAPPKLVAVC